MKHTPGPYRRYGHIITDSNDVLIADLRLKVPKSAFDSFLSNLDRPLEEQTANAILFQTAPDLLAALETFRHEDGCFCEAAFAGPGMIASHTPECIAACAAIAKAKGEVS